MQKSMPNHVLKINRLYLENITYFSTLSLELGARATIILGQNGSGKTSILRALALAFIANEDTQDKLSVQSKNSKLNFLLKINRPNEEKSHLIGKIELFQYEDEGIVFKKGIQISPNSIVSKTFGAVEIEEVLAGDYQLITNEEWYFHQLILGFSQIQTQGNSDATYSERESYTNPPSTFGDIESLLYNYPMDILGSLEYWIWALDADSQKKEAHNKNKKNTLKKLFDTISDVIGTQIEFHTSEATTQQIWVKILTPEQPDNTEIVPFQLLSQGFKNVFAWVGHLVRRMAEAKNYARNFHMQPAIVMVDEIDTYLHPKWQKNILKALLEHFPNTQFVVTTHSPFVANYIPPTTVAPQDLRVYMLGEKEAPPRLLNKLYGRDIANIFYDMEMPERPVEVAKDIEQIFQQLETVSNRADLNKTKKLIQMLKTILPAEDAVFVSIAYALAEAEWVLSNRSK
jgi:predicted ATP-binding protein involved in virulence